MPDEVRPYREQAAAPKPALASPLYTTEKVSLGYDAKAVLKNLSLRLDADDRIALPIAHWRAPREDESEKLMAGLGVIRNALTLAEVDQ